MSCFKRLTVLVVAVGFVLCGCGRLPKPFKSEPGSGVESPLVALHDSFGVVVVPVFGAPPGVAGPLADIMAAELRRSNIPATTGSAIKDAYLLEGDARFEPAADGQGIVAIDWTVSDKNGALLEELTTRRNIAVDTWQGGARVDLNALAAEAVPRIVGVLQADLPQAALAPRPTIGVVAVTGAPGDGNEALRKAFTAVLKSARLPVAEDPGEAAIQVFGEVAVSERSEGKQKIEIKWILRNPDGDEIGTMSQSNTIEKGKVSTQWGPLAYDVTFAMVDSIVDVLETIDRADDIRLGR